MACLHLDPHGRVSISTTQMEWKCTLAIRSYDWLEWFCQLCVCMFVWSCLHTEHDLQQSPFNKTRVKLPLIQTRIVLQYWKMFCLGATGSYRVTLEAPTFGDLGFYSAVTHSKKGQLIPRVIQDIRQYPFNFLKEISWGVHNILTLGLAFSNPFTVVHWGNYRDEYDTLCNL